MGPRPKKPPPLPIITGVKDGLTKLVREIAGLRREVKLVCDRLAAFEQKHPLALTPSPLGLDDWRTRTRSVTDEPNVEMERTMAEIEKSTDLEPATQALFAALKDLDGALRDIRRARNHIEVIADDAELQGALKKWLRRF